jgi:cell wall assembly regulator SMI1
MLNVDERLAAALSRLEAILDRSGAAIVPLLHPGIGQPEVLTAFDGIGLRPSAEVVTWFGWHDGAGGPGMPTTLIELVPGGEFYGAHHLCREYVQARSVALEVASNAADLPSKTGFHATADDFWRVSWFPLLRLFGKGYLAVDLGPGDETSPVHIIWHDTDPYLGEWPTVGAFVETVISRFEKGIYAINGDGHIEGQPSIT